MSFRLWKDLARKLAKKITSHTDLNEDSLALILEDEIKKFAQERIVRVYYERKT